MQKSARLRLATMLVTYLCGTQLAHAQYTEKSEVWTATSEDTWVTKDLSGAPFSVPANAIVEVAVVNDDQSEELWGGVRAVGSGLERRFLIREAEGFGDNVVTMHVQTDSSSQIQYYSDRTVDVDFVLLGYWTSGTYVEAWNAFTAGSDNSWQDVDLSTYGVGPAHVAEIVMTNDHVTDTGGNHLAGVRTNGSSLDRRIDLQNAEDGGSAGGTMFVKADTTAKATVEVNAGDDTYIDFYLVGYWSVAPAAYTELFVNVGSPTDDGVWEDLDLTTNGVPDSAIAEFVMSNEYAPSQNKMGVRQNGPGLIRELDPMEAEDGGGAFFRAHVLTDSTATIEFQHEDVSDAHTFRLVGYWDTCDTSIAYVISDLGAVTAANSSLGWHINSSWNVAGFEEDASGDPDAWITDGGTFTTLGVLGGSDAEAHGINNNDMVVGWSDDGSGNRRAYTWTSGGGMTDLGTVAGRTDTEALSVNANSEVVGTAVDFDASAANKNRVAFLYLPSDAYTLSAGMNSLGTLGGSESVGTDINDSGEVVGGAQNASGNFRPFRWATGTMTDLGTLGGDSFLVDHRAEAINAGGNACGRSYTASNAKHAFYYDGSMNDLGVLTDGSASWAFGINDSNIVVGTSDTTGSVYRAFVWDSTNGLRNLNNLIPTGTGWTLLRATDVNNDGFIVGFGTNGSAENRAFLLTPSCSAGGGAAKSSLLLANGTGLADKNGVFYEQIIDSAGEPLGKVELLNPEPGIRVDYEVFESVVTSAGTSADTADMHDGFDNGISLARLLHVATTAIQAGTTVTVNMTFTRSEIADLGACPSDLELFALDDVRDGKAGAWVPAGKNIGNSEPTNTIGDSGHIEYGDGTVDYWAVRAGGGVFTVGKSVPTNQPPEVPPTLPPAVPGMCGIAMIQTLLLCSTLLGFRRWPGRLTVPTHR